MKFRWSGIVENVNKNEEIKSVFALIWTDEKLIQKTDLNIIVIFYPAVTEYIYQDIMYSLACATVYRLGDKNPSKNKKNTNKSIFFFFSEGENTIANINVGR
jgi:hypothetical protein